MSSLVHRVDESNHKAAEAAHDDTHDTLTDDTPTRCWHHGCWCPCPECEALEAEHAAIAAAWRMRDDRGDTPFSPDETTIIPRDCHPGAPAYDPLPDLADVVVDSTPTETDNRERMELMDEMTAERHLNRKGLGLADLVSRQVSFYLSWGNATGRLIAGRLDTLASEIRSLKAETPEDFEARDEIMVRWNGEDS